LLVTNPLNFDLYLKKSFSQSYTGITYYGSHVVIQIQTRL